MPKPKAGNIPPDKLELYQKLVGTNPKVERKGASVPYTSVNGNMFSYLSQSGRMALRLPSDERKAFIVKYQARLCQQYGVVQPEYVEVPDSLLASTAKLKKYFDCSFGCQLAQAEAHGSKEEKIEARVSYTRR